MVAAVRERHRKLVVLMNNHSDVVVARIPDCDFCKENAVTKPATVDGRTIIGPWANMCQNHFQMYGVGLGLGKGQRLILKGTGS